MQTLNDERLSQLEYLGKGSSLVTQIHALLPYSPLIESFSFMEVALVSQFLEIYRVQVGQQVIQEDDVGAFMVFVIEGQIEVFKRGTDEKPVLIAVVGPGGTVGEMSLIDGGRRSATCIASAVTLLGVLSDESLAHLLLQDSHAGAKILVCLLGMLARRLRETSSAIIALSQNGYHEPTPLLYDFLMSEL